MPGGARQLAVAAVTAPAQVPSPRGRPGWPSAPRRRDPGEVGPPSGGRRREDVRTPDRLVVALSAPRSRRGTSVQPVERTSNVRCPVSGVRCSGVRCSGVRTDRPALSAALPPRGPRRAGHGVGGCGGPPAGRSGSRCPGVRGRVVACIGPDGKRWCGGGRARLPRGRPSPRADAWPASRLAAPPGRLAAGPTRAGSGARVPAGWGSPGRCRCSPVPRRASGRLPAWCPTMGLDQAVVTTLGGR
jgi:hypothetical protein